MSSHVRVGASLASGRDSSLSSELGLESSDSLLLLLSDCVTRGDGSPLVSPALESGSRLI